MTAHTTLMRQFQDSEAWRELSMREYDVLYTLAKHDGPLRLCELRDGVLLSQPALSRLVDRLVTRGLVTRTPNEQDRRAVEIALTPEGKEAQRAAGRIHALDIANEMAFLTPTELATLQSLCKKLSKK